ncbi:hypothetical protein ACTFBT_01260 [Streptomyces microflavus]|uniref:hypothetical protein n=1 Tax=Streptomyces TaxID=1883 RepID=UPI001E4338F9|nr:MULTISPECIES: hypothetical protein [Streptomyces]MDX2978145.1 hypothetical protein [Streptomyces sp. NRRL_B-2249]
MPANTSGIETDTSGWTTGANTTLSKSTRFYAGASSLGMTATAAGSVTATISARVAVVAGQEYTAYSYWANVVAAAGRSATVRVDWYAAVSGGSALSSVTSATSALPTATTWQTPPPILIATAPVGAQYASVTVSCTGLSAGATVVTDVVSFGLPFTVPGSLFPYDKASAEVSIAEWGGWANATISRTSTVAWEGWYSLQAESLASGVMEVGATRHAVGAGTEYVAQARVRPAVVSSTVRIEIRWYDADIVYLSRSVVDHPAFAGQWTACAVTGVAPPGAAHARMVLVPTAMSAAEIWAFDHMALRASPIPAGSLIGYNTQSMEVDASGWTAVSGCTIGRTTETAWEGAASLRINETGSTGMNATVALSTPVPVTPRQAYQVTPRLKLGAGPAGRQLVTTYAWLNSSDELIRSATVTWSLGSSAGTGWYAPPTSAVAPSGAASLVVSFHIVSSIVGQPAFLDDVQITPGGLAAVADAVPDSYSASVALQGLTSGGYTYWGLWRQGGDGALVPIRGPLADLTQVTIVGDTAVVEDYEAPLGVEVRYYLKVWTGSSYRAVLSDPVMIPEPVSTEIVLKDPGLPARQTTAVVSKGGQPTWTRRARQGVNAVRGRSRPIVISDMRTSREGTMTLVTETAEDLASMWWLLESGNILLIQWPSLWGERDVYVAVGDVAEAPVVEYAEYTDRTWTVPLTEVDRPIGGATGSSGRTWATVLSDHIDGMDLLTSYASWLGVYTGLEGT